MTKVIIKIMQFLSCSSEAISYAYSNPFLVYNLKKKKSENNELLFEAMSLHCCCCCREKTEDFSHRFL